MLSGRTLRDGAVGRNAAIRRYDPLTEGQPLELFPSARSKAPVVRELLASPWIARASDLVCGDGAYASRRSSEAIEVEWDDSLGRPGTFLRGGRRYRVDTVIQVWVTERSWWDPRSHLSLRHWRVLARGGVYDLVFDRVSGSWRLAGIQD